MPAHDLPSSFSPAKAGIQYPAACGWTPAFAREQPMTNLREDMA